MATIFRKPPFWRAKRRWFLFSASQNVVVEVDKGDLALTGKDIALNIAFSITKGDLTLTGKDITLPFNIIAVVSKGDLTLTGKDITLTIAQIVIVTAGTLTLTGQSITLSVTETQLSRAPLIIPSHDDYPALRWSGMPPRR